MHGQLFRLILQRRGAGNLSATSYRMNSNGLTRWLQGRYCCTTPPLHFPMHGHARTMRRIPCPGEHAYCWVRSRTPGGGTGCAGTWQTVERCDTCTVASPVPGTCPNCTDVTSSCLWRLRLCREGCAQAPPHRSGTEAQAQFSLGTARYRSLVVNGPQSGPLHV